MKLSLGPARRERPDGSEISSIGDLEKSSVADSTVNLPPDDSTTDASILSPPPDGGTTTWTQAVMGHLVAFNTWGFLTSFGVFQSYYETHILASSSSSDIAWIGSFQLFLIMFISTFSGRALDAGYFRHVYIPGSVLLLLGVFMTSLCQTYWQVFLAQGVCIGLGAGLMFVPSLGLVATYFSSKKVVALAFYLTGAGTGGMVFPAIASQLLGRIGFAWTMRVLGFIILGLCIVTAAFFKTRLPPRKAGPLVEWTAFKEPTFMLYIAGMWFNFWPLYFAFYYISSFATSRIGLTEQQGLDLVITINGIGIVGRLIPAFIASKYIGPVNTIIPAALVSALLLYCWTAIHTEGGIYAFAVIYGFFGSGVQGLWPGGLTSLTDDITKTGTRMGMGFSIASISLLTGPPIGGALISARGGDYLYAQMWAASSFILGSLLLLCARFSKVGWKLGRV